MDIVSVVTLFGGLAFFLFGMSLMGDSLKRVAGSRLEVILWKLTSNPFKGVLLGTFVTAVIQSSSATSVMVVGFVNSGMMKVSQAIGIIMGANIGTTATGWILSLAELSGDSLFATVFSIKTLTPLLALIGIILYSFVKNSTKKQVGLIFLGFSILMFGMQLMSGAMQPLRENETFINILTMFSNPFVGLLIGTLFTALIQSASASVGILQALSLTCPMTYATVFPILMGMNIGACAPVLFSGIGANKNGKRASLIYLYHNLIGTVIFMILYYSLNAIFHFSFANLPVGAVEIALANTVFNVFATVILLPFTKQLEKLVYLSVREDPNQENDDIVVDLLEERFLKYPPLALEQSRETLNNMARSAKKNLFRAMQLVTAYSPETAAKIRAREEVIDKYEDKLGTYLVKLSEKEMTPAQTHEVSKMLHGIGDFERIGDHAVNILETAAEIKEKGLVFSDEAKFELDMLAGAIKEIVENATEAFLSDDVGLAGQIEPLEETIDMITNELKMRHVNRLQNGTCTLSLGFVFNDLITNYERIADHCSNIAVCILQLSEQFEAHEYMKMLKTAETELYRQRLLQYEEKYYFPIVQEREPV